MFPSKMDRRINRRQQGDLGESSAIEWFTRAGAVVSLPVGHSPDYDLLVDFGSGPLRVQVKTSVRFKPGSPQNESFQVQLATNGGNQSWNHEAKLFDPTRADLVFVLVSTGRRWLIPSQELQGSRCIALGGERYSEFEITTAEPIQALVYGSDSDPLSSPSLRGSVGAGEPSGPVKSVPSAEWVRIPPPPSSREPQRAPRGLTKIARSRQIVIPKSAFLAAGFSIGDRLKAYPDGDGRVLFQRVRPPNANGPPGGGPSQVLLEGKD